MKFVNKNMRNGEHGKHCRYVAIGATEVSGMQGVRRSYMNKYSHLNERMTPETDDVIIINSAENRV